MRTWVMSIGSMYACTGILLLMYDLTSGVAVSIHEHSSQYGTSTSIGTTTDTNVGMYKYNYKCNHCLQSK